MPNTLLPFLATLLSISLRGHPPLSSLLRVAALQRFHGRAFGMRKLRVVVGRINLLPASLPLSHYTACTLVTLVHLPAHAPLHFHSRLDLLPFACATHPCLRAAATPLSIRSQRTPLLSGAGSPGTGSQAAWQCARRHFLNSRTWHAVCRLLT